MELVTLQAERRTDTGKGVARKLRQNGRVPAVCYGLGSEAVHLSIAPREVIQLMRGPLGRNTVFNLDMGGEEQRMVALKEIQVHPVKRRILHIDFLAVNDDSRLVVDVPVRLLGKSKAEGVGGKVEWVLKTLRVASKPAQIPAEIVIDVSPIKVADILYVESIPLPEGVQAVTRARVPVLSGRSGRSGEVGDDDEGEE